MERENHDDRFEHEGSPRSKPKEAEREAQDEARWIDCDNRRSERSHRVWNGRRDDLTWEEFKAESCQDPETGAYVVDGDVLIETEEQLRYLYEEWHAEQTLPEGVSRQSQGLTIGRVNGQDNRLSAARAADITFCVSQISFGSRYGAVVTAMNNAAADWEAASGVNYTHRSEFDGNCNASQTGVFFDVRQVSNAPFTARAFFPSYSWTNRNVLIDSCTTRSASAHRLAIWS